MSRRKKVVLAILIVLLVTLVLIVTIVPRLLEVDRYRPQVAALLEAQMGKHAEMGHLNLAFFPRLSIRVDDFTLKNPAGFPAGDFVRARRIYAVVALGGLWHHQAVINSLELQAPAISLLCDRRGNWNFDNKPSASDPDPDPDPLGSKPLFTLGAISNIKISQGSLTVANLLPSGQAGPAFINANGISGRLRQFDLNALTENGQGEMQGRSLVAEGAFEVDGLDVMNVVVTGVKSKLRLLPQQVFFDGLEFKGYDGSAGGDVDCTFAGPNPRYTTQAKLSGVNVAKLLEAFPEARGKLTGVLDGNVRLDGEVSHSPDPLAGIGGSGHLTIHKGRLPTLQLDANLLQLFRVAKMGPASGDPYAFSSIAADFSIANSRINTSKIQIVGNGVEVDASGNLTLAGKGGLDYQGVARITTSQNTLTTLLGSISGATLEKGKMILHFSVAGSMQNPQFTLKPSGSGRLTSPAAGGSGE